MQAEKRLEKSLDDFFAPRISFIQSVSDGSQAQRNFSMNPIRLLALAVSTLFVAAPVALAHVDPRVAGGSFAAGLVHPLSGWDHLLAAFCIGLLGAQVGGLARWALPGAFVAAMIGGCVAGLLGYAMPVVEYGIAMSLIVVGLAITYGRQRRVAVLAVLAAVIGAMHGHAHGTEMPALAAPLLYALGFVASTCGLQLVGFLVARRALRSQPGSTALRWAGATVAATGLYLILGISF